MQLRKSFALLAAMLVGFGAGSADAANVTDVSVTSPDSGVVRGIDSTFVIKAVVEDFSPEDQDGVLLYLWSGDDSTGVLTGPTTNPTLDDSSGSAVNAAVILGTVFSVASTPSNGPLVAVGIQATGDSVGHADSVTVTQEANNNLELKTYTWYGKVTGAFGTKSGVRAAAIAYDATEKSYSEAGTSPASQQFRVDGDRPTTPEAIVTASADIGKPRTSRHNAGTDSADFFNAGRRVVLGITDTLAFNVKLGASATGVLTTNSTLSVQAGISGGIFNISRTGRSLDTLKFRRVIAEGDFGNLVGTDDAGGVIDTIEVWVVDAAGNRSNLNGTDLGVPQGVTVATHFFVDGKAPLLDAQIANGDTILPVSNDTITDGSRHAAISSDLNQMRYTLNEALDSLLITFDNGDNTGTIKLSNTRGSGDDPTDPALGSDDTLNVNFTAFGNADSLNWIRLYKYNGGTAVAAYDSVSPAVGVIKTGLQTLKFQAYDLAGNKGTVLTRTNVYVDVDDLGFDRLFPTAASALDTIEEETAKVVFRLTEDADSVLITYTPLSGNGVTTRKRHLVGPELTSDVEVAYEVDSLVTGTLYKLQLLGADLAGNYTQTAPDTFVYDTTYVVPVIASFDISVTKLDRLGSGADVTASDTLYHPTAGDTLTLTMQAKTIDDANAVTYKNLTFMKVTGGTGASITGTGVSAVEGIPGRFELSADDWITGARTVKVVSTLSPDSISVQLVDSSDVAQDKIYAGTIDSVIGTAPAALNKIALAADDTVGQGDAFWVGLTLADKFGNTRTADDAWVELSTSALGVSLPNQAIEVVDGVAGFWANSAGYAGDLKILARSVQGAGSGSITGSTSVYVSGDGATVLDDPDTLIAQDYMGAKGEGDQGGFVLLTFPVSEDHSTLSGYRIYREISVTVDADENGDLVELGAPQMAMVPWGHVDAVPGQSVMRVVVATLDGDATKYGVAAERGGLSSNKEAFDSAEAVGSPYELMAETMVKSKEAAQIDPSAPVFASLTPEAKAFEVDGVLPNFKSTDGALLSAIRQTTDAVRAIDNIAPAPVANLTVADTPGDVGGSISVSWTQSADDRMLTTTVPSAVSDVQTYSAPGVEGYNIYRRIGDSAWQLVGQTNAGATSFEDATVFNGVRYAYKVEARDADNVTDSQIAKSAMAIRNNVFDTNGQRVLGLFGGDTKVDVDDFFIFADHFGMQAGVDGFDKAFDLAPNNAIDLADFFVFADNYGREVVGAGKVVPTMAGLNSDARFALDAGSALPSVGEELSVAVSLEDYVEIRGYGLTVEYDSDLLEFVEPRVVDNALGEQPLAAPHAFTEADGKVSIAAFGETMGEGDLGLNLVFRAKQEIESSYIDVTSGALQDGSYGLNRITSPVSIRVETRPEVYALADNYPNPFNPETTIKYQLPEAGQVTLEVYNMLGQVVKTLVNNQFQNAGRYTLQWDATNDSGQPLSSGVYFYRIVAGGEFQSHKKMLLLK